MKSNKILLVEDDENLGTLLFEFLQINSFEVKIARDGEEGLNAFEKEPFDLFIFDVMMPKIDGFTLAKKVREKNTNTPIIFLTAKSQKEDRLEGFKIGADDYLTKPFSLEELHARILAILRRVNPEEREQNLYSIGKSIFDAESNLLKGNGEEIKLTTKESGLLKLLLQHKNEVVSREILLEKVWGANTYFNGRSMDVYITKLRKYIKNEKGVEIMNHHGIGFKLIV